MAKDTQPMMDDSDTGTEDGGGIASDASSDITLDMTNPDIADAFSACQPGETLEVVSKDDTSIVLKKGAGYDDTQEEAAETPAPKSGVERLMANKMGA